MQLNNFHYAMTLANELYGLNMLVEDFEEVGLVAWNKIGNLRARLYKVCYDIDPNTEQIELPSNCIEVEAVTYDFEDWNYTSNIYPNGDYSSNFTESYIEGRKLYEDQLYTKGKYVKYTQVGNTLYINKGGKIFVLYKGEILDEDDLPEISDKEAMAIATYCAYAAKFKEGLLTNNSGIIQVAQILEQKWNRECDSARVPNSISQNAMNEILDAKTSWNRKIFNKSFKPLK